MLYNFSKATTSLEKWAAVLVVAVAAGGREYSAGPS